MNQTPSEKYLQKKFQKELSFNKETRQINRKFSKDWGESEHRFDRIPDMVTSLITSRKAMIEYIDALHDKIDDLIIRNKVCDNSYCHTANCQSDHK